MSDKIIRLSKFSDSAITNTIKGALTDAIDECGKGGAFANGKKVVILALDESDGQYKVNFIQAGMKMSDCVTLCEVAKAVFLKEMNY